MIRYLLPLLLLTGCAAAAIPAGLCPESIRVEYEHPSGHSGAAEVHFRDRGSEWTCPAEAVSRETPAPAPPVPQAATEPPAAPEVPR